MDTSELPTVVYIAGYGRSGSTVLDLILGASDSIAAVGELFMFFRPSETRNCSCGSPVAECPFWSEVRRVYQARHLVDSRLYVPGNKGDRGFRFRQKIEGMFVPLWPSPEVRDEYVRHERALLAALEHVSGRHMIVDSSKTAVEVAWRPTALMQYCGAKVKLIHLVRDGRAVMWSVMRGCNRKLEQRDADPRLSFPRLRSVLGWTLANLAAWQQGRQLPKENVLAVSYEDLARDPAAELTRIGQFLELDLSPVIARIEAREPLAAGHSISGNRLRHTGLVEIREDDEWRGRLPWSARLVYWLLGWPAHLMFVRSRRPALVPAQKV